jgi:hypothetical protein
MRESSRLTSPTINRNTHIDHVADAAEEVVKIAIRHLEGHVPDEEGLGGGILRARGAFGAGFEFGGLEGGVLHGEAAAFEELLVEGFDGFGGGLGGFEVDVAEAAEVLVWG